MVNFVNKILKYCIGKQLIKIKITVINKLMNSRSFTYSKYILVTQEERNILMALNSYPSRAYLKIIINNVPCVPEERPELH